ncbi:anthranilate synthase component I family protein [Cohnella zeiphila]|uniref:Anthranilate synthase component I family protein n=1 Tax=Cohnella zeiphila TaxID=2761120 RepID=A0A7X0SNP5_9BACL|nr:anthranilate synthase component I family protein [Cohnella zeiphila]MBB6733347.1 anthranilate synthase component I family protein [Cohnella zeiphila]
MEAAWTSKRQWEQWIREPAGSFTKLPYLRKYRLAPGEDRPSLWRSAWEEAGEHAFVLESGRAGRYSFLGLRPSAVIRGTGSLASASVPDERENGGWRTETMEGPPLELVRGWMARHRAPRIPDAPKFVGGCVGFWGYDVVRSLERLPDLALGDLGLPDYAFLLMDELWIVDHDLRELICAIHVPAPSLAELSSAHEAAAARVEEMKRFWDGVVRDSESEEARTFLEKMRAAMERDRMHMDVEAYEGIRTATSKDDFMRAVRRIQEYIAQGDVFQVNLSLRQSLPVRSRPEDLYEWLRKVNPSPYMGFLRFPDFTLVSGSPELLAKLEGERMSARPIAGTRRRGRTDEEDRELAGELLSSSKERAEHIMLVDLMRNDLGRVAAYGTVKVPELLTIERYSHVMHLVSQVEGALTPGKDAFDVLASAFPGGTITGAPKIRTMEIIEELEPVRRGPYTGSLGWIDYSGNMEFNIIIRTMAIKDGICHIQAGAGIVIDSDPQREFYECLNKAKALWKAVQYGERQSGEA